MVAPRDEAGGGGHPAHRDRLLDGEGDAEKGRQSLALAGSSEALVGRVGFAAGVVEAVHRDRIDPRRDLLEQRDVRLDNVARAQFSGADRARELERRPFGRWPGLLSTRISAHARRAGPSLP